MLVAAPRAAFCIALDSSGSCRRLLMQVEVVTLRAAACVCGLWQSEPALQVVAFAKGYVYQCCVQQQPAA